MYVEPMCCFIHILLTNSRNACPVSHSRSGSEMFRDFASGTNRVPLKVKLKLPFCTAFLIPLLIFLATLTPARPAEILMCLVTFASVIFTVMRTGRENKTIRTRKTIRKDSFKRFLTLGFAVEFSVPSV